MEEYGSERNEKTVEPTTSEENPAKPQNADEEDELEEGGLC